MGSTGARLSAGGALLPRAEQTTYLPATDGLTMIVIARSDGDSR